MKSVPGAGRHGLGKIGRTREIQHINAAPNTDECCFCQRAGGAAGRAGREQAKKV